jgi:hypothetical protein
MQALRRAHLWRSRIDRYRQRSTFSPKAINHHKSLRILPGTPPSLRQYPIRSQKPMPPGNPPVHLRRPPCRCPRQSSQIESRQAMGRSEVELRKGHHTRHPTGHSQRPEPPRRDAVHHRKSRRLRLVVRSGTFRGKDGSAYLVHDQPGRQRASLQHQPPSCLPCCSRFSPSSCPPCSSWRRLLVLRIHRLRAR